MRLDSLLGCALVTLLSTSSAWASVKPEDGPDHPAGREFVRLVRRAAGVPDDGVKRTSGDAVYGTCLESFMAFDTLAMLSGFDGAMKKDRKADVTRYAAVERDCVEAARKETKTVPALRVEPKYLQLLSYRFATDNRGVFEAAKAKVKQTRPQSQQQQLGPQGDTRPLLPMDKAVGAVKNGWNNVFGGGAGGRR